MRYHNGVTLHWYIRALHRATIQSLFDVIRLRWSLISVLLYCSVLWPTNDSPVCSYAVIWYQMVMRSFWAELGGVLQKTHDIVLGIGTLPYAKASLRWDSEVTRRSPIKPTTLLCATQQHEMNERSENRQEKALFLTARAGCSCWQHSVPVLLPFLVQREIMCLSEHSSTRKSALTPAVPSRTEITTSTGRAKRSVFTPRTWRGFFL